VCSRCSCSRSPSAAVYVCKEIIEHVLLAAGDGHHHHLGENDDEIGYVLRHLFPDFLNKRILRIEFPPIMTPFTFPLTIATALLYNNHAVLIDGMMTPSRYNLHSDVC
jgi:hypothetical protein